MEILDFLEKEKKTSVRIARNFLGRKREESTELGIPMRVMLKELSAYTLRGGKWHRPTLVRMAVKLLGKRLTPEICRASLVAELIHRYLLIHDDIMDQDLVRHGGPTMQKFYQERFKIKFASLKDETYSLGMAIVAGDILNSLNHQLVVNSGITNQAAATLLYGLNQELLETGAGWLLETDLKNTPLLKSSIKQVEQAMKLVSAHYSVLWPLRLGEILAGREYGDWIPELETYGAEVGLAFQIKDDVLAIFGDQDQTGKPVGNDLREGKKTLLVQYAYEKANKSSKKYLEESLNREVDLDRLNNVRDIMNKTGALNYAQEMAETRAQHGIKAIIKLQSPDEEVKQKFIELAIFLADRKK